MRLVKLALLSVFVLLFVSSALSLLFPAHLRVIRSINISASGDSISRATGEKVMAAIGNLRTWDQWNSFIRSTPLTGRSFSPVASGKGAWLQSDQLSVAVTGIGPDSIHMHWDQVNGKSFESGYYIFHIQPDSLTVQAWMDFHFKWYPWQRLGILLYDKRLGPALEESLAGLKDYIKKSP